MTNRVGFNMDKWMIIFFFLVIDVIYSSPIFENERYCKHTGQILDHELNTIDLSSSIRSRRSESKSFYFPLRIATFFDESIDKLPISKRTAITHRIVTDAVQFWENVLSVKRASVNIKMNHRCENNQFFIGKRNKKEQFCKNKCVLTKCGESIIKSDHLESCKTCNERGLNCKTETQGGKGVENADFILYVSAVQTKQCGSLIDGKAETIAYSAHCQQESELDRPVAGHINVCPFAISDREHEILSLSSTLKHELLHALGFSSSLFSFWRDKNGIPRTPRKFDGKPPINYELNIREWSTNTIKKIIRPWKVRGGTLSRTFHIMVTPRVVEEVRRHFNCYTLDGAELEDQGGDGTALTHWEKRIFQNEAMTGTIHTESPEYSRVTFAALEDTGWYNANYSFAKNISWGRNAGCDFVTKSCKELMEKKDNERYFCQSLMNSNSLTQCTKNKKSLGSCNLVLYQKELPKIYQNFDTVENVKKNLIGNVGGSITLADYCPYVQEFTWKVLKNESAFKPRGTKCTDSFNLPSEDNNYALESYGSDSVCFETSKPWEQRSCAQVKQWKRFGAGCYRHQCANGSLFVIVQNVYFPCSNDKIIDIQLKNKEWIHKGNIKCPKCEEICGKESCYSQKILTSLSSKSDYKDKDLCNGESFIKGLFTQFGFNIF